MENWIIACSGGPDSMYLLEWARKKYKCIVVHINYHKRLEADYEQKLVEDYCNKYNLLCHVFDYSSKEHGNFQSQAREFRYLKFKEIVLLYNALGVMVAHHQDDVVESIVMHYLSYHPFKYFGIKERINFNGLLVYRPLLSLTKQDILDYCIKNNLVYGIDKSNFMPIYLRNWIRQKIDDQNRLLILKYGQYHNYVLNLYKQNYSTLNLYTGYYYIYQILKRHLSWKEYQNVWRFVISGHKKYVFRNGDILYKHSNKIMLKSIAEGFSVKYFNIDELQSSDWVDEKNNDIRCVLALKSSDFPIVIRSYLKGDKILLSFGHKKLSRYFIDKKIDLSMRDKYWVIENCFGEIIFVNGIGADLNHRNGEFILNMTIKTPSNLL